MNTKRKLLPFHIGMRTVKTAVAVGVSVAIGFLINSPYPPFLAIGALGAMESSITASLRSARNSTLGNLIGALLSMAFVVLFHGHLAVGCSLGVLLMIVICNLLHMPAPITNMACVVFCCTFIDIGSNGILWYGLLRFRDIVIGSVIALAVNMLIRPYSGAERTKAGIIKAQKAMLPLLEQRVLRGRIPDLRELRDNINALDRSINVMLDERMNKSLKKAQVAHLRGCQQLLWKMRDALIGVCCIDSMPTPSEANLHRLYQLGLSGGKKQETILDGKCEPEDTVVFNYYVKVFLDSNDFLTQLIEM